MYRRHPLALAVACAALLCVLAASLASCTRSAVTSTRAEYKGWNVIIISMNNVAADHMSLYGYGRPTTPRLQQLASGALVFDRVFAPTSWTLPGATSLMTSLQPYSHRVQDRMQSNLLNPAIPTLGEIFKQKGYATAAFTGGLDYRPRFGHLRAMDDTSLNPDFTKFSVSLKQAERWVARNEDKPFFLVLQGYDAHPPFQPPAPHKGTFSGGKRNIHVSTKFPLRGYKEGDKYVASYIFQESDPEKLKLLDVAYPPEKRTVVLTKDDIDYLRDLYDDCVLSVDAQVADFIEGLDKKVRARTVIVVLSEHGEMFAKHGRFGRAGTVRGSLYNDVVHVPLLILTPDGQKGRVGGMAQLIDVAPTLLDLVGIEAPSTFQGKSLLPMVDHPEVTVNPYVYAGAGYNLGLKGRRHPFFNETSINEFICDGTYKLIREVVDPKGADERETWEMYDLKADPDEQTDIYAQKPAEAAALAKRLAEWSATTQEAFANELPSTTEFPPDFLEKARKGGYW